MSDSYVVKTFGELQAGDVILDENGKEVIIKTVYDAHTPEQMYEIQLEDGTSIKASGNHLWYIETHEDLLNHGLRLKKAENFLKTSPQELLSGLEEIALMEEPYEVTFLDILDLFDYIPNYFDYKENFAEAHFFVKRILLSVGHITEHTQQMMDFGSGELGETEQENLYDGRAVAQQILALTGQRKYKKQWPVLRGRVVTTNEIFETYQDADIPVAKKRKSDSNKKS